MRVLQFIANVFFFPGDLVRRMLGINLEEDGGIIRSFINMIVWGSIVLFVAVTYF